MSYTNVPFSFDTAVRLTRPGQDRYTLCTGSRTWARLFSLVSIRTCDECQVNMYTLALSPHGHSTVFQMFEHSHPNEEDLLGGQLLNSEGGKEDRR